MRQNDMEREGTTVKEAHDCGLISFFSRVEKQRIRAREERTSYTRVLREAARNEAILDLFRETIAAYEPAECMKNEDTKMVSVTDKAVYAM